MPAKGRGLRNDFTVGMIDFSGLTPGITRRAPNLETTQVLDKSNADRGRVQAVVRPRVQAAIVNVRALSELIASGRNF